MKPPRLIVLLSGGGRTLVNLAECISRGELNAEIALVISSRSTAKGIERARELGLCVETFRPRDFPSRQAFEEAQQARILEESPDLLLLAGYLLHFPVPTGFTGRVLNIHPALLPAHGGKGMYGDNVHAAVLEAGDKISGCTVHVVDEIYDNGPPVLQMEVPVLEGDTVDSLAARVFEAECRAYPEAVRRHADSLGMDAGRPRGPAKN